MAQVMGMTVTSRMKGDDNHNDTKTVPVKKKYETYSFLISKMDVGRSWDAKLITVSSFMWR